GDVLLPSSIEINEKKVNKKDPDGRGALLTSLHEYELGGKFSTEFLQKGNEINLSTEQLTTLDDRNPNLNLLIYTSLVQRSNRNQAKEQMITGRDISASHRMSVPGKSSMG